MLGEMPEIIVVAVKNTNRSRDVFPWRMTFRNGNTIGGDADNYLSFFRDELQPFINTNYRTAYYRILYGQSIYHIPKCYRNKVYRISKNRAQIKDL